MNLILDIGNTQAKVAVFKAKELISIYTYPLFNLNTLKLLCKKYPTIQAVILSSVKHHSKEITNYLKLKGTFIELDDTTKLPIKNLYKTPKTLGNDRLAAITGASSLFPKQNILVIDAGTCIKYDFINKKKEYLGGGISPGIKMRFKSLCTFTDKLPWVDAKEYNQLIGNSTQESILAGVQNGVMAEVKWNISQYKKQFPDIKIILTGGDSIFFERQLKSSIFAAPNLVLQGLNIILNYNNGKAKM